MSHIHAPNRLDKVLVTKHALARWRERVKPTVTEVEIKNIIERRVRKPHSKMVKRGDGYVLFCNGLKILVKPDLIGWTVLTVWPNR